jgi:hypothetical protein
LRRRQYNGKEVAPSWKMKVGHPGVRISTIGTVGRVIYAIQDI